MPKTTCILFHLAFCKQLKVRGIWHFFLWHIAQCSNMPVVLSVLAAAATGCRQWPWLMHWFEDNVESALTHWFGEAIVIMDEPNQQQTAAATACVAAAGGKVETPAADGEACKQEQPAAAPAAGCVEEMGAGSKGGVDSLAGGEGEPGSVVSAAEGAATVQAEADNAGGVAAGTVRKEEQTAGEACGSEAAGMDGEQRGLVEGTVEEDGQVLGSGAGSCDTAAATNGMGTVADGAVERVGRCTGSSNGAVDELSLSRSRSSSSRSRGKNDSSTSNVADFEDHGVVSRTGSGSTSSNTPINGGEWQQATPSPFARVPSLSCCSSTTDATNACSVSSTTDTPPASPMGNPSSSREGAEATTATAAGSQQRYVFGFQPHGLYPTGAGFLPWMPSFRRLFPGVHPVTLVASVLYIPPFIRDISCWAGFRQVRPRGLRAACQGLAGEY